MKQNGCLQRWNNQVCACGGQLRKTRRRKLAIEGPSQAEIDHQYAVEKIHAVELDVQRRMSEIKNHYIEFSESKQQCLEQAFKHLAGMFCAWCDPKWENWLLRQEDGSYELNMNENVCHSLSKECYGYVANLEKSSDIALEVHRLNRFLNKQAEIKKAIDENDFLTVERAYAKSQDLSAAEEAEILSKSLFTMPETCTKEECPWICEEFITPNGISIDEILGKTQVGKAKEGFLGMISEDLKVKFSKSTESISPETITTSLDTTVESTQEILMSDIEKSLLDKEPVTMMIDTFDDTEEEIVEEEPVDEEDEIEEEEEVTTAMEEVEEVFEEVLAEESSGSAFTFVFSWAILLYVIIMNSGG